MLIYKPKGKAREYSPLALNTYTRGCSAQCSYCFCRSMFAGWGPEAKPRDLTGLEKEAEREGRQILLSFVSDPYGAAEQEHRVTRKALGILKAARCSVAILTKGGAACLDDLDTFRTWPDGRINIGATLTFVSEAKSREVEPGAALPAERIETFKTLHESGVKTWASIEPVLDPDESIAAIVASLPYVDAYKVGKLNHRANTTDWAAFVVRAVEVIREAGRVLYVKDDLRPFAPPGFLRPAECDPETVFLPDRPEAPLPAVDEVKPDPRQLALL